MNYWVVGAMWGGKDDVLSEFLTRGYWYCWDVKTTVPDGNAQGNAIAVQQDRFRGIRPGDRIAVKKMLGQGSSEMSILAIGIVKVVDVEEWRVYVDWMPIGPMARKVPLRGCTASVHGPFESSDLWVHQVFHI
ncbi:hypothetical protein [Janthinobacterium agaricidamnosum]|uniref:hypothetical protein n=1 Tax=Janthinobacterium agaricidamnosum TaxID=55508 RepID=UPI00077422F7|nr:hypothetical protein [Janthinobacterium agaricidamnosum]